MDTEKNGILLPAHRRLHKLPGILATNPTSMSQVESHKVAEDVKAQDQAIRQGDVCSPTATTNKSLDAGPPRQGQVGSLK